MTENPLNQRTEPIVNNTANLFGEKMIIGRKVKARSIQIVPATARMTNVVSLSFVWVTCCTWDEAQLMSPADSSSLVAGATGLNKPVIEPTRPDAC